MNPCLVFMDPSEWEYLTEGGANIVFRYCGKDLKYQNKILRIRKHCSSLNLSTYFNHHNYLCELLGCVESVDLHSLLPVEVQFLDDLNQKSVPLRPAHRLKKGGIVSRCDYVVLMPDLVSEYFSCEIKPKWSGIKHSNSFGIACHCRFCSSQILKGRRKCQSSNGSYCPKLFFSKSCDDVLAALSNLFDNPSNQLKLYSNSHVVDASNMSILKGSVVPVLSQIIMIDPLFQRFIELQCQLLDQIQMDNLRVSNEEISNFESEINRICTLNSKVFSSIPDYIRVLFAMSLRDSSLIISFRPACYRENGWKEINIYETKYYYRIHIIDLDVKPIQKLSQYIEEIKLHG